jgi:hypothetical protein
MTTLQHTPQLLLLLFTLLVGFYQTALKKSNLSRSGAARDPPDSASLIYNNDFLDNHRVEC